ncbi:MAG: helix-turn-helix transcriptional regulator [Bacteroidetes bacterium]|nr:helix-turn-helix transcriptional regulator [Bacteroidota bacterium]
MKNEKVDPKEWFAGLLDKYKDDSEYIAEGVLVDITEQILDQVNRQNLSRSQLAQKLNCSNAYISKLLNGSENMTLKKIVQIAQVLDCRLDVALVPKQYDVKRHISFSSKKLNMNGYNQPVKLGKEYEQSNSSVAA